jgi:replicative DNA helicase
MVDNLKNKDIEEAVLSAIIMNDETYPQIAEIFDVSLFSNEDYQNVAKVIIGLKNEGKKVDIFTVSDRMKKSDYFNNHFGIYELTKLSERLVSTYITEIHSHTLILKQYAMKRQVVEVSNKTISAATAYNSDVFDVIDFAEKGISEITNSIVSNSFQTPEELQREAIEENKRILALKGALSGITSGFRKIDDITGGWQNGTLNIVAGATSMGKSAIVLDFLLAASLAGNPCAFFSLEVSNKKIYSRLRSKISGIDLHKITKQGLNDSEERSVNLATQHLQRAKILFEDISGITIFQLKNKARYLKRKHSIKWLAIDYLQLMEGMQKGNREQEIASISRGLKSIAKELDIPIIALSQLSRKIEERSDKEPKLSDLRESGSIEQDADIVAFIYRPEYYGITFVEGTNESLIGKAKFFIKKNREGELGEVKLDYIGRLTKFQSEGINDYEPEPLQPNNDFENQTDVF